MTDAPGKAPLLRIHDCWLAPRDRLPLAEPLAYELITYVVAGAIAYEVGSHTAALLGPGEFHRTVVGLAPKPVQAQTNPSRSEVSHVVQFRMHDPRLVLAGPPLLQRFSFAQRRGLLYAVAAPAGAAGSLVVQSEITLYSSVLDPGQHIVHGFAAARDGVLHVVSGELSVANHVLGPGDAVYALRERSLAFTTRTHAEVLLGDVQAGHHFDG